MTIQIEADQAEAMKAALKEAIPKVSRDPHGDALQQLLGLLDPEGSARLSKRATHSRIMAILEKHG